MNIITHKSNRNTWFHTCHRCLALYTYCIHMPLSCDTNKKQSSLEQSQLPLNTRDNYVNIWTSFNIQLYLLRVEPTFLSSTRTWLQKPAALFVASCVCRHAPHRGGNACARVIPNPAGTSCFYEDRCYNMTMLSALCCPLHANRKKQGRLATVFSSFPSECGRTSGLKSWYGTKKRVDRKTFYEITEAESKHCTFEREVVCSGVRVRC